MTTPEPRRAEAYAARRVTALGGVLWQGYARCPSCPWWAVSSDVNGAKAAAEAHRCPEVRP